MELARSHVVAEEGIKPSNEISPITLSWKLSLSVKLKDGKIKDILKNVEGIAKPGQLLGVMGPSGAGKTSLLNCLSLTNRRFVGHVYANGEPAHDNISEISSFVHQEDLFIPTLKVREHVMFHAILRLGGNLSREELEKKVDATIDSLGLSICADTMIGGGPRAMQGISGGESKRLAFATEILSNPSLFFADEPTSGLDSYMAETVVTSLRSLANEGRTVICTIHQPSSQVLAHFTNILVVAAGRTAYLGPFTNLVPFFTSAGYECPSYYNPSDYIIQQVSVNPASRDECMARINRIIEAFASSEYFKDTQFDLTTINAIKHDPTGVAHQNTEIIHWYTRHKYRSSWRLQMSQLIRRNFLMFRRDPVLTKARLGQAIILALFGGLVYLREKNNQSSVQDINGSLFFSISNQAIGGLFGVLQVFPVELPIFLREHKSGAYSVDAYFLSRMIAELPFQILFPSIFGCIVYWMVGYTTSAAHFFTYLAVLVLTSNAALSLGYALSATTESVGVALAIAPVAMMPLLIFGGFFVNNGNIPIYFSWLECFSFFKYGFHSLAINEWETKGDIPTSSGEIRRYKDGSSVLSYMSINPSEFSTDIIALFALLIGFRLVCFLFLLRKSSKAMSN